MFITYTYKPVLETDTTIIKINYFPTKYQNVLAYTQEAQCD